MIELVDRRLLRAGFRALTGLLLFAMAAHGDEPGKPFRVWAVGDVHGTADIRHGRESLARPIRQAAGLVKGAPAFDWDIMVDAGDLVLGDRDGVVVVPRARLAQVTERLALVEAKEAELHAKMAAGETRSLLERDPALADQIRYVD